MTLNVRLGGELSGYVASKIGDDGRYENVSEFVRDLIRRDLEREEQAAFEELKAELRRAFSTPDADFFPFDAETFLAEIQQRPA